VTTVVPVVSAVTSPDPETEATAEDPLHVPPAGLPVNKDVEPMWQINVVPVIVGASTVIVVVVVQPEGAV
jgi:hypothetical protein